jgi:hypothetical protein
MLELKVWYDAIVIVRLKKVMNKNVKLIMPRDTNHLLDYFYFLK